MQGRDEQVTDAGSRGCTFLTSHFSLLLLLAPGTTTLRP